MHQTHESFVNAVRELVTRERLTDEAARAKFRNVKLVYGRGERGLRGVTCFGFWQGGEGAATEFVEVCAAGEQSALQLIGTTIHELGHVLAGWGAGHGPQWKEACRVLGLPGALATSTVYEPSTFDAELLPMLQAIPEPTDGKPSNGDAGVNGGAGFQSTRTTAKGCQGGVGTKGGKSRGVGSGSRLRLYVCGCVPAVKVRVASDTFQAHCDSCGAGFTQPEK